MSRERRIAIELPDSAGSLARSTRVPRDVRARARRRLGLVALVLAVIFLGFCALSLVVTAAGGAERLSPVDLSLGLASLALFAIVRAERVPERVAIYAGLIYFVAAVGLIHVANIHSVWIEHGHVPTITFGSILIVALPLIVPTSPRRTVVAVALAASTAPLAVLVVSRVHGDVLGFDHYLRPAVVPVVSAAIAVFGSRVVHGISVEVARARELGAYRVTERIGAGGMGEVWRAEHSMLARPAAVKLIRSTEEGVTETSIKRFEREAQVTAQLRSPHTIELFDFGIAEDGSIYYVMELLDGVDLQRLVVDDGPQPPERVAFILEQMCHSLHEAHVAGLVHRDVKPANTFVCCYGQDYDFVKVLDFGLVALRASRDVPQTGELTVDNVIQGTPAFMSPEMIRSPGLVGPRSDLYALGCVAYWLLTARQVFEGDSMVEVLAAHLHDRPSPPSELGVAAPAALEELVMDCLAKDPEERPASAAAIADRLRTAAVAAPWTAGRARAWWESR